MPVDYLKTALVTLFVTLDPPELAPVFVSLTLGMTRAEKREVALRACVRRAATGVVLTRMFGLVLAAMAV